MPKLNANITAQAQLALAVACTFCGAKPGQPCWTLKGAGSRYWNMERHPHKVRVRASWRSPSN